MLALANGVARAQSNDDPPEDLPPIVQAAQEPAGDDASAPKTADEGQAALPPIVQAVDEPESTTAEEASEFDEMLPPIVQAVDEESANPIDESAPGEMSAPEMDAAANQPMDVRQSAGMPYGYNPLVPLFTTNPAVQQASVEPSGPQSYPQPIDTTVPLDEMPPILSPSELSQPTFTHQESYRPADVRTEYDVPAAPTTGFPLNGTPTESSPTGLPQGVDSAILPQETVIELQQTVEPNAAIHGLEQHSVEHVPDGVLESGFNSRGQCAHCGGAGCEHCTGADPVMTDESGIAEPEFASAVPAAYDCCGFMSSARHYLIVDYFRYERRGDVVLGGNFSGFADFDWNHAGRVTLGHRWDCASGDEISYLGVDPWIAITRETDAGGGLQANLVAGPGFAASSLSAFNNATFLEQVQKTDLQSVEFNKTCWGWDVVKTTLGARFILFDDELRLSSANTLGEQGFYNLDIENRMVGPQFGIELFYDVGYRLSFSMVSKIGAYANLHEGQTSIVNDGTTELNNIDEETSFSASGELGLHWHYQLLPRTRLRFGYDVIGLFDVATTADNFNPTITPSTGLIYQDDDNAVFQGVFAGIEFYR